MKNNNWKYLYRIRQLEIKSWMKYLMLQGKEVIDYVLGELTTGTDITIDNTVEKTFYKFDIKGNSVQDGTPAPDNEVPILSAGDNGSISEKIVNKNLFDKNDTSKILYTYIGSATNAISSQGSATSKFRTVFIKCKTNTTYYLKKFTTYNIIRIGESTSDNAPTYGTQLSDVVAPSNTKASYTTSSNAKWLVAQISSTLDEEETQIVVDNFMICYGNTEPTTYVAHQEQTYTIPVQQPMRSIGTVRDEFIENKERHNVLRYYFTGTENFAKSSVTSFDRYTLTINDLLNENSSTRVDVNSNYFKGVAYSSTGALNEIWHNKKILVINYAEYNTTTLEQFKSWLAEKYANGNPLYVDYVTDTPVDLPCTSEQIAILENLPKSYNEQTNIYSLDVTPAYLEVQAYVKKEEVIEND